MIHDYKPVGISVLPYLRPLKQFELFSGKGMLTSQHYEQKKNENEEKEWILKTSFINMKNQNLS